MRGIGKEGKIRKKIIFSEVMNIVNVAEQIVGESVTSVVETTYAKRPCYFVSQHSSYEEGNKKRVHKLTSYVAADLTILRETVDAYTLEDSSIVESTMRHILTPERLVITATTEQASKSVSIRGDSLSSYISAGMRLQELLVMWQRRRNDPETNLDQKTG